MLTALKALPWWIKLNGVLTLALTGVLANEYRQDVSAPELEQTQQAEHDVILHQETVQQAQDQHARRMAEMDRLEGNLEVLYQRNQEALRRIRAIDVGDR